MEEELSSEQQPKHLHHRPLRKPPNNRIQHNDPSSYCETSANNEDISNSKADDLLKELVPLLWIGRLTGMNPISFGRGRIFFSWKSPQVWYTLAMTLVFASHIVFELMQLRQNIAASESLENIVVIFPFVFGNTLVVCTLLFYVFKGAKLVGLFQRWAKVREAISTDGASMVRRRFVVMLYSIYGALTLATMTCQAFHYQQDPRSSVYWTGVVWDPSDPLVFHMGLVFYMFKAALTMIGTAMMEVILSLAARGFRAEFQELDRSLQEIIEADPVHRRSPYSHIRDILDVHQLGNKPLSPKETTDDKILSKKIRSPNHKDTLEDQELPSSVRNVILRHQLLSQMVEELNHIYGPLILLQLGIYMLMICSLIYVSVYNLGTPLGTSSIFFCNTVSYLLRLFALIPIYSGVNSSANDIGNTFAGVVTFASPAAMAKITFFVSSLDSVGISAWGFFIIRLSTLLTFASTVVTYLVVMFQSGGAQPDTGKVVSLGINMTTTAPHPTMLD